MQRLAFLVQSPPKKLEEKTLTQAKNFCSTSKNITKLALVKNLCHKTQFPAFSKSMVISARQVHSNKAPLLTVKLPVE